MGRPSGSAQDLRRVELEILSATIFLSGWFKKGSGQFQAKEWAQVMVNHLEE